MAMFHSLEKGNQSTTYLKIWWKQLLGENKCNHDVVIMGKNKGTNDAFIRGVNVESMEKSIVETKKDELAISLDGLHINGRQGSNISKPSNQNIIENNHSSNDLGRKRRGRFDQNKSRNANKLITRDS